MKRLVLLALTLFALPLAARADDLVPLDLGGGQYLATVSVPAGVDRVCMDTPGDLTKCGPPIAADCGLPFFPGGCTFTFEEHIYSAPNSTPRVFAAKYALAHDQRVTVRFMCPTCRDTLSSTGILRDAVLPLAEAGAPFTAAPVAAAVVPPPDPTPIRAAANGFGMCQGPEDPDEIVPVHLPNGQYLLIARFPDPTEADSICFVSLGLDLPCTGNAGRTPVVDGFATLDGVKYNDNGSPIPWASVFIRKVSLPASAFVRAEAYFGNTHTLSEKFYRVPATGGTPVTPPPVNPPPVTPPPVTPPPVTSATCAAIRAANPNVLHCEDFEDLTDLASWTARYGSPFDHGIGPNFVANLVPGGFLGSRSLAQQFFPGNEGGTTGLVRFAQMGQRRVTITFARMFGVGFKDRDHSVKDNRFEESGGNFEIFGESSTGPGKGKGTQTTRNRFPFGSPLDIEPSSCIAGPPFTGPPICTVNTVANVGYFGENDVHYDLIPGPSYDYVEDMKPGQWVCLQAAFDGWGTDAMTARYWVNGEKVIDIAQIKGTKLRGALKDGVTSYDFVAFYNDGYPAGTTGQRFDDNIVITSGAEPVSCAAIGFQGINH